MLEKMVAISFQYESWCLLLPMAVSMFFLERDAGLRELYSCPTKVMVPLGVGLMFVLWEFHMNGGWRNYLLIQNKYVHKWIQGIGCKILITENPLNAA